MIKEDFYFYGDERLSSGGCGEGSVGDQNHGGVGARSGRVGGESRDCPGETITLLEVDAGCCDVPGCGCGCPGMKTGIGGVGGVCGRMSSVFSGVRGLSFGPRG